MNRDAIEVGAFSWARIQRLYDADVVVHWQRCEAEGLQCPQNRAPRGLAARRARAEIRLPVGA